MFCLFSTRVLIELVRAALESITLRKAPGSPRTFLSWSNWLFGSVTCSFIFKAMISLHYVPPVFTRSFILPISNYRGISIASVLSKIFEYVLHKGFLDNIYRKIHHLQGGFRKGYATCHTSFILQEAVLGCRAQNQKCFLAFLDARKAFDTVWHQVSMAFLTIYGFYFLLVQASVIFS